MKKESLKTIAYAGIKDKIITCQYAPGAFLNEELLCTELSISRTPIREALNRLEQEGLVEIMPKKGIRVTPLSIKDINTIFEIRFLYEPYILRQYGAALDVDELTNFFQIFAKSTADSDAFRNNDYFYELDSAFHQMILSTCPNKYIQQSYGQITNQSERFRFMTGNISNNRLEDTFREHNEIISACLQKNWDLAVEKLIFHLEESKKATFTLVFDNILSI